MHTAFFDVEQRHFLRNFCEPVLMPTSITPRPNKTPYHTHRSQISTPNLFIFTAQEGMETIAMFTKHEGDAEKILFDLQANWYETEIGKWIGERMR
jgi:hypothetical protein